MLSYVLRSICVTLRHNREDRLHLGNKNKYDLFCIALGLHYLYGITVKIGCTSAIKINMIYFVLRSVCTIFAEEFIIIKMEVTITNENFKDYLNGELPLVVDLWATWCGPCRALAPIVSELAEEYDGRLVVGKCDIEEYDDIATDYGVRNIPTILFFKGGELVDRFVGAAKKAVIEEKFKALL